MANTMTPEQRLELQRLWDALLRHALWKSVPFQDAEDMVSNALRSGLEHHDAGRGELLPFCRTILSNAIKNYWRDRKVALPIEDEQFHHADEGPDVILEEKERTESMRRTIEQLSGLLSKEELAFMRMLGQVVDELGERAVSETARRLGLKPAKGWDLFRRIQRKAQTLEAPARPSIVRKLPKQSTAKEEQPEPMIEATIARAPLGYASKRAAEDAAPIMFNVELAPDADPLFTIAGAMAREEAFERFVKRISDI